jgi:hypothetical protein
MGLELESRPSDSHYIERVWRSRSVDVRQMTSVAVPLCDLVFWEQHGRIRASVQGPESKATMAPIPADSTFFGIVLSLGTVIPHLATERLVDGALEIPDLTRLSVWIKGSAWRLPTYDNAEGFVDRLVREGVIVRDPVVAAVMDRTPPAISQRSVQRHFVASTGLTQGAIRQIYRARHAAVLLREGMAGVEVVHQLGYFDQPHLSRSLNRYIGLTATRLAAADEAKPVSLLYKT